MIRDCVPLGKVAERPYDLLAYAAIRHAEGMPLFALTLDPDGVVWAEAPASAIDEDLIGVWEPTLKNVEAIREALREEAISRGLRKAPPFRAARRARSAAIAENRVTFG